MCARHVHFVEIAWNNERFLFVDARFLENAAGRIRDEALAPELDAVASDWPFEADAIRDRNVASVRDGVAALDYFPGAVLIFAMFGFFFRMPANRGRIKKNFGAL